MMPLEGVLGRAVAKQKPGPKPGRQGKTRTLSAIQDRRK
jgi:hypothetical protein